MRHTQIDWLYLFAITFLLIFGIAILRSVAPNLVLQQGIIMFTGLILAGFLTLTDYRIFKNLNWLFYILSLSLLLITLIIGQSTRGTVRWIQIGNLRLQASEIAKPLLIVFFSAQASKLSLSKFKNILFLTLLFLLPAILIFRQPDLGSTLIFISLWLGIIFAAGAPVKYLVLGLILSLLIVPISWTLLQDYQKARLISFVNPLNDPLESGYNAIQSIIAVGSGQLFGRGLGQGTQSHLSFLPERHTDFIFASLTEELGFVGSMLLLGLFTLLFLRILNIAQNSSEVFGKLICIGVFSMLVFQVFINMGMNIGLLPITGLTLPLISFGGSSLLSTLISLGLVGSVSLRQKRRQMFEIH